MCSPKIMQMVNEKVRKEAQSGGYSRRNFLKFGAAAAAGAAGLMVPQATVQASSLFRQDMMGEIIDLSHVFGPSVPVYTLGEEPAKETAVTVENDGFYIQKWTFFEHAGTHMDAPAHFAAGGETVDNLEPSQFIAPAVVIDISEKAAEDNDTMVTVEDLEAWEAENGEIPVGALVCMYSGWEARWDDAEAFRNADEDGVQHYPGFGGEASAFLLEERDIAGIGVDTLSLDIGASSTFDVHLSILPAGKYGIENLANLEQLIGKSATVMVGIPRYETGSGGPCRVLAMV